MIEVSYSEARAHLAELLDRVSNDREVVRIHRQRGHADAVLLDADEYASLAETAHLLSSPANVRHLLTALAELESGEGQSYADVEALWRDLAADSESANAPTVDLIAALKASMDAAKDARRRKDDPEREGQNEQRPRVV